MTPACDLPGVFPGALSEAVSHGSRSIEFQTTTYRRQLPSCRLTASHGLTPQSSTSSATDLTAQSDYTQATLFNTSVSLYATMISGPGSMRNTICLSDRGRGSQQQHDIVMFLFALQACNEAVTLVRRCADDRQIPHTDRDPQHHRSSMRGLYCSRDFDFRNCVFSCVLRVVH